MKGLRPWEIRRLTLPEVVEYLEDTEDQKTFAPENSRAGPQGDSRKYAEWVRGLKPDELLELALEGSL